MLALLALRVAGTAGCPGSPVADPTPHDSAELGVTFPRDSCAVVAEEMLARVAGTAGWKDPHTRHGPGTQGRYTLLSAEPAASDGTPGAISLSRVTADGRYTDLMDVGFEAQVGGGCTVLACSESQVPSYRDMSTNFCNLHDLYCGLADGCPFALHALDYTEGEVALGYGATADKAECVRSLVGEPPATRFLSQVIRHIGAEGLNRRGPAGSCRLFLGPGFRLAARWNRLVETVKTRKKRGKRGKNGRDTA